MVVEIAESNQHRGCRMPQSVTRSMCCTQCPARSISYLVSLRLINLNDISSLLDCNDLDDHTKAFERFDGCGRYAGRKRRCAQGSFGQLKRLEEPVKDAPTGTRHERRIQFSHQLHRSQTKTNTTEASNDERGEACGHQGSAITWRWLSGMGRWSLPSPGAGGKITVL